jgi:arylamine N-acetyltransferase
VEEFAGVIRSSFAATAHFMNHLRIARFFEDYSIELLDRKMWLHRAGRTEERELSTLNELEQAVRTEFRMPRCPVRESVAVLERLTGKPLFGEPAPAHRAAP